jgi:tRNA-splicing ligase RtcB (3'-phosphate/5'-hydroxy nucleic acid ligase)
MKALNISPRELAFSLIYDGCHNIAKIEEHVVDGKPQRLCVHRKGATRAFAAGHPQIPADYQNIGQPVLIPGDMGRYSYLLVGTQTAMEKTFGSTCHGAGRVMSRAQSKKQSQAINIDQEMARRGVVAAIRDAARWLKRCRTHTKTWPMWWRRWITPGSQNGWRASGRWA